MAFHAEAGPDQRHAAAPTTPSPYVELGVSSPFSFLRGASDAIELVLKALPLGYDAIGIADRNTLAGVVRMHSACTNAGIRPLIGCRLDLTDAPSLLPTRSIATAYGRLSRLLSLGKMRAEKGDCELSLTDVAAHSGRHRFHRLAERRSLCFRTAIAASSRRLDVTASCCGELALSRRRQRSDRTARSPRERSMAAPSSRRTTSIITRLTAARCRTSSPASARR